MIPIPQGRRVWLVTGHTDMRKGFDGLALIVQETLKRDPHCGHLFVFRGRRGDSDQMPMERRSGALPVLEAAGARAIPVAVTAGEAVTISTAQLGYLLSGIDWRMPQESWRPTAVGVMISLAILDGCDSFVLCRGRQCTPFRSCRRACADLDRARGAVGGGSRTRQRRSAASQRRALIALLKLEIEKLRRTLYGARSERKAAPARPTGAAARGRGGRRDRRRTGGRTRDGSTMVKSFERKRPGRKPFPEHLPRERVVIAAPKTCPCCGSHKLSKLGEDVTETLEVVPRQWKVIQTVRERFSCRECETITQPPAPFHVTPRGFAGPTLLAMILFEKFGQHQPLNRQSERYAREGVDLSLSTLADQVGACAAALRPLARADRSARSFRRALARRRHDGSDPGQGQDRDRPRLDLCPRRPAFRRQGPAGGALLRLARPLGASIPSAISADLARHSAGRRLWRLQRALSADRRPGPILEALCWSHARRKFFELADIAANARRGKDAPPISPIALEAVKRIDASSTSSARSTARRRRAVARAPEQRRSSSRSKTGCAPSAPNSPATAVAKAIDYMLTRWPAFTRFLDDGRICLTNNAAERALRGLALGRNHGSSPAQSAGLSAPPLMYTLIQTAKLNDIDPQAWLADVLARIADIPQSRLCELLPWNWRQPPRSTPPDCGPHRRLTL